MTQSKNDDGCKSKCNRKHLTLRQRTILLDCIRQKLNQKETAETVGVSKTTVSRELLAHRMIFKNRRNPNARCIHLPDCQVKDLCKIGKCHTLCKNCKYQRKCSDFCPNFKTFECSRLNRFPYVCDGCSRASICSYDYYRYVPEEADKMAKKTLVESRRGINMTEEEFAELDKVLVEGTAKGQSIEHIVCANKLEISPSTIRNYVRTGITSVKSVDMPRGAAYKPRKKKISPSEQANSRKAKTGRDLASFLKYADKVPFLLLTQMDTVEGSKRSNDAARLLTFVFVKARLFYCECIPNGLQKSVLTVFDRLYRTLGKDDFSFFFGTLLTDNGVEFNNPEGIEIDPKTHRKRSNVFFCNPYSSWEKGAIEVAHELLRRIIPKGTSLRYLTAEDTKLINSHINSYIRASNRGKSAYDVFVEAYGERGKRVLTRLNIERINLKDVILDPSLLRKPSD